MTNAIPQVRNPLYMQVFTAALLFRSLCVNAFMAFEEGAW